VVVLDKVIADPFELVAVTMTLMNLPLSVLVNLYELAVLPEMVEHFAEDVGFAFRAVLPTTLQRYQVYL
jgi:hypothetical protein